MVSEEKQEKRREEAQAALCTENTNVAQVSEEQTSENRANQIGQLNSQTVSDEVGRVVIEVRRDHYSEKCQIGRTDKAFCNSAEHGNRDEKNVRRNGLTQTEAQNADRLDD